MIQRLASPSPCGFISEARLFPRDRALNPGLTVTQAGVEIENKTGLNVTISQLFESRGRQYLNYGFSIEGIGFAAQATTEVPKEGLKRIVFVSPGGYFQLEFYGEE